MICSWHKFVVDAFFVPDSFSVEHEDFASGFDSENHVDIDSGFHGSFKDQVSGVLGGINFWVDGFKVSDADSGSSDASGSGDFLVDNFFSFRKQFHFDYKSISGKSE